jgi:CheY-like chemotaxis protein
MSEAAVISPPRNDTHSSMGSVLIIDDEAAIRESLETLLQMEGYAVDSADSGEL